MNREKRERVATLLVETTMATDKAVSERHGVSVRTLQRYRRLLDGDAELSRLVAEKKAKVADGWADEVPGAMRSAVSFLRKAAENGDAKDPAAVHAVAGALKMLSEVCATWKILDARLAQDDRPPRRSDRPVAAEGQPGAALN